MVGSVNRDYAYTASTSPFEWTVECGGETVAHGVSVKRPGEDHVTVYVNRIVEDLLESSFPTATGVTADTGAYKVFELQDASGTTLETYELYDASEGTSPYFGVQNEPVNGHCDPRQRVFVTRFGTVSGNVTISNG